MKKASIQPLEENIRKMITDRDWDQYHDPKSIILDIASEVGELADIFRYLTPTQLSNIKEVDKTKAKDECADIMISLITLCHKLEIDLLTEVERKIKEVKTKYPIDKAKGSNKKYNEL